MNSYIFPSIVAQNEKLVHDTEVAQLRNALILQILNGL